MKPLITALAGAAAVAVALPIIVVVALLRMFVDAGGDVFGDVFSDFETWFASADSSAASVCRISVPTDEEGDAPFAWQSLNEAQRANAVTIAEVAVEAGLPEIGVVVALTTAIQESSLRNLANPVVPESLEYSNDGVGEDHDSIGLFQQRPSMGWGTVAQIMDPRYATAKFIEKLLRLENWESRARTSVAEVAQAVQISAFPDAYADHVGEARRIAAWIAGEGYSCERSPGAVTAEGWTHPLPGGIFTSGYRTPDRPTHNGADFSAAKGTPIYAAAEGQRRYSGCDIHEGGSCDEDGSLSASGCGWYLEILHEGGVLTRYCHLESETMVRSNEHVAAGDLIGYVGSSGRSSGPHLHFEVRLGATLSDPGEPTNPVTWMRSVGVEPSG